MRMVQGLNWNNYSASQIVELKQNGVNVPDDVYNEAQEKMSKEVNQTSDDATAVSYTITDDAGEINEAEQEVATAQEYGANLKTILGNLISKCTGQNQELGKVQEDLDKYTLQMEDVMSQTVVITEETTEKLEDIQEETEATANEIAQKQDEIEAKTEELEGITNADANEVSEEDAAKAENLQAEIEDLGGDVKELKSEFDAKSTAENMVKVAANVKLQLMGKTMEDVKNDMQDALNKATNATEYADVTIEKGMEASNIDSWKDARKAGFGSRFLGLGGKREAHRMGDVAIVKGEELGNTSVGVGNTVKQLGSQYDVAFAETSSINNLTSKEYVDTSRLADLQNPNEVQGFFKGFKRAKIHKQNQAIITDIANQAKAQYNAKTEE